MSFDALVSDRPKKLKESNICDTVSGPLQTKNKDNQESKSKTKIIKNPKPS